MQKQTYLLELGNDTFVVELNDWAEQANGKVLVRHGSTLVLATAVLGKKPREGVDYFPLTVEYEERFYAAGRILGSRFVKRENRPSEEAILVGRLIDRSIRPRFDMRMRNEVQVVVTVLSVDEKNDPDVAGVLGASLALSLSDIPWLGPIAAVRVGKINNQLVINPNFEERAQSAIDMMVSGTEEKINMIEAGASELNEENVIQAIDEAHKAVKKLITFQRGIIKEHAMKKAEVLIPQIPEQLNTSLKKHISARLEHALYEKDKLERQEKMRSLQEEWLDFAEKKHQDIFSKSVAEYLFEEEVNEILHRRILQREERPDARKTNELRELRGTVSVLPRTHGSAMFMRGQTHALSVLTLGSPGDEQIIEGMEVRTKKHFMHHYNFPPYSVGEIKPMRGPGRREIGHGALAERALLPVIPPKQEFPYTIRLVSEILSSNGSSSMASVCGSTLAMMDAGVPIKKPVAGIAMGLVMDREGNYKVLTDIQGPEDHHGDMDFKVAGTEEGVTAIQMDVKIEGVTVPILKDAFAQAREARMQILQFMKSVIAEPRKELSPYAPRITILTINPEKIGALIGPGGKVINEIIAETGVQIDIEDDGTVYITSDNADAMSQALAKVKQVTKEIKPGELLEGKVTRLFEFGAMVEVAPRVEGMVHISELAPWRVEKVTDIIKTGDVIPVIVKEIDDQGRINLSLKRVPGRYDDQNKFGHPERGNDNHHGGSKPLFRKPGE